MTAQIAIVVGALIVSGFEILHTFGRSQGPVPVEWFSATQLARLVHGTNCMRLSAFLRSYSFKFLLAVALLNWLGAGPLQAQVWPAAPDTPRIRYEGSFRKLDDGAKRASFWHRLLNVMVGAPPSYSMVRPFGISTDPQGRIIVVDTEQRMVHVLDYARHRYLHLAGNSKERFVSPIGVALDEQGNIFVTDSYLGKIFAFRPNGKFWRLLGDVRGEGIFKRPTGLAYDAEHRVFYVTDTLRDKIFVLDPDGRVLRSFGERGTEPGQFNYPVAIAVYRGSLYVVDAMNFRVQILDLQGRPLAQFGMPGDGSGSFAKPKSVALDSEGHIYVVDSLFEVVQVFDRNGRFLLAFGGTGTGPGQFELPTGIFVDPADRIYVSDSFNSRVQVFQYLKTAPDEPGER